MTEKVVIKSPIYEHKCVVCIIAIQLKKLLKKSMIENYKNLGTAIFCVSMKTLQEENKIDINYK